MTGLTLAHVGYVVKEMGPALARFRKEGAVVILEPVADPVQKVEVALLQVPGEPVIELVAPLDPEDTPIKGRLARGGGLDHLCYEVDDLPAALEAEAARRSVVVCPPTHAVAFGRDIAFVHRRSGLVVEYLSRS